MIVELVHCGTKDQLTDIMTNPLKLDLFLKMRWQLGMCTVQEISDYKYEVQFKSGIARDSSN